jgi:UDP-4-amino-4,6-dideoxy-N-acetyl-beta-L-altrosamine N-acetyltransferase
MLKVEDNYVRKMVEADLELVLSWRNHPDVRKYMYTQHEIAFEVHKSWFKNAICDDRQHLLIFEQNNNPLGFIKINQINKWGVADWGFYLSPDAPKGTGRSLGKEALNYAFKCIFLHKVCGQSLGFNERSINFHLKLGFKQEGTLRQQHFDGQKYHDIVHFGLLATEWPNNSEI